jgi:hypothetical protein
MQQTITWRIQLLPKYKICQQLIKCVYLEVDGLRKVARKLEDDNIPHLQIVILGKFSPSTTQALLVAYVITIPTLIVFILKSDYQIFLWHPKFFPCCWYALRSNSRG